MDGAAAPSQRDPLAAGRSILVERHVRSRLLSVLLSLGLGQALGCTLDTHDLDAFRSTARGPDKLSAVLADGTRSTNLRADAALYLLDLERNDVDGRALLFAGLARMDLPSKRGIIPTFERGLLKRMQTPVGKAPKSSAVRAKDVGVELLPELDAAAREELGSALLRWMGEDLPLRADVGNYALEAIASKLGSASAKASSDALRKGIAADSLSRLTESIDKYAEPALRESAAAKVVEVEQGYRGAADAEQALLGHALPALGRLIDTEAARSRLVEIAADAHATLAERTLALSLLEKHVLASDLALLSPVLLDDGQPLALREQILARVSETRAKEALPALLQLVSERKARSLREPATALAIELGGERILPSIFRALPSHWNVSYARSELESYAARIEQLPRSGYLVALLGGKLFSIFWWNRVIALHYFAHRADPFDATWRLRLQVDDKQEVNGEGFPPKWTIGREATAALRTLSARSE